MANDPLGGGDSFKVISPSVTEDLPTWADTLALDIVIGMHRHLHRSRKGQAFTLKPAQKRVWCRHLSAGADKTIVYGVNTMCLTKERTSLYPRHRAPPLPGAGPLRSLNNASDI